VVMLLWRPLLLLTKDRRENRSLHKGVTPSQDFFLLVNSTDARYKKRAPKELPPPENQESSKVWDPAELSVRKLDTELRRREPAVKKRVCYGAAVLVTWSPGSGLLSHKAIQPSGRSRGY